MNDKNDNGIPSVEIDVRKTFDIDVDMKVMAFKEPCLLYTSPSPRD